ncbi:uncharacterized protein LOC131507271 [Neofelis nebulosa]|uniref:uncharacterized protein LOC131507271 n=1 Tax=Neofelis nebulosa TaxID=61452 RepID=UPI00272B8238|nr:uncharacterized protein LOC131507271 [Neofelis nebulosa]
MGRAGGETEEAGPPMSVPPAVPRRPRRRRGGRRCCCCRRRCFPTPSAAAGPAAAGDVPPLRSPALASASPRRSFTHTGTAAELGRHSPGRNLPSSSSAAAAAAAAATAPASASSPSSSRPPPPAPRQPPPPCGASPPLPAPTSKLRAPIGWRARQFLLGCSLVARPSSRSSSPSPPPSLFSPSCQSSGPAASAAQSPLRCHCCRQAETREGEWAGGRGREERGSTLPPSARCGFCPWTPHTPPRSFGNCA